MKYEPGRVWRVITFETSWFNEEVCSSLRALFVHRLFVRRPPCPALIGAEATGSGADLFLEADGGESGWLCVVVFPELPELESFRLDCVSSPEFSSVEACKRNINMLQKPRRIDEISQGMDQLTCELS
jgi:hypothetical protein